MTQITFRCKTLSPLFIGNADDSDVEFRPNVFKSSMEILQCNFKVINETQLYGK